MFAETIRGAMLNRHRRSFDRLLVELVPHQIPGAADPGRQNRSRDILTTENNNNRPISRQSSAINNNGTISSDKTNPYRTTDELLNYLHLFSLLLSVTMSMKCQICKSLLMDCTVLNCGHAFCKFCLTSWLQLSDSCPLCRKSEVRPMCNRCFQLDAFVETMNPTILKLLAHSKPVSPFSPKLSETKKLPQKIPSKFPVDIRRLQNRVDGFQAPVLQEKEDEIVIREARRRIMSRGTCVLKSCPNRSMLHGVIDLGFGLRSSVLGFFLVCIGCVFLAMSVCYFSELLDDFGLYGVRRMVHVLLILYILGSHAAFFRVFGNNSEDRSFWRQIIQTNEIEERDGPFQSEKLKMLDAIAQGEIDLRRMQLEACHILINMRKIMQ